MNSKIDPALEPSSFRCMIIGTVPTLRQRMRDLRFRMLWLLVPLFTFVARLLIRSWRLRLPEQEILDQILDSPRVLLGSCHSMLLPSVPFAQFIFKRGRRLFVLTSPSQDGRLAADVAGRFGVETVHATVGRRAISGSRELISKIREGNVSLVPVDGPRGPALKLKPGFVKIATAADALLVLMVVDCRPALRLPSWDRMIIPLPFARLTARVAIVPLPAAGAENAFCERVQIDFLKFVEGSDVFAAAQAAARLSEASIGDASRSTVPGVAE